MANCNPPDVSKDQCREILELFDVTFKLIILWLNIFPTKYMKYYEVHKKVKLAYLLDREVAVAAAGHELIKILNYCFCNHERITKTLRI